jgi:hypothetical protein
MSEAHNCHASAHRQVDRRSMHVTGTQLPCISSKTGRQEEYACQRHTVAMY